MTEKVHGLRRSRTHLFSLSVSESQELSCGLAEWFWLRDCREIIVKTLALAAVTCNVAGAEGATSVLAHSRGCWLGASGSQTRTSLFPTPCPLNTHAGATWVTSQHGVWFPTEQTFQENKAATAVCFRVLSQKSHAFIPTGSLRSARSALFCLRRPHREARPTGSHLGRWLPQGPGLVFLTAVG